MVIYTHFVVGGSPYNQNNGPVVERGTDQYDGSSNIEVSLPNAYGRYANKFSIGQDMQLFVSSGVPVVLNSGLTAFYNLGSETTTATNGIPDVYSTKELTWSGGFLYNGSSATIAFDAVSGAVFSAGTNGSYIALPNAAGSYLVPGSTTPVTVYGEFQLGRDGINSATSQMLLSTRFHYVHVRNSTNDLVWRYSDGTQARTVQKTLGAGDRAPHDFMAVFNGGSVQTLYLDGSLVTGPTTHPAGAVGTFVEDFGRGSTGSYLGWMKNFRVWNGALTGSEYVLERESEYPVRGKDLVANFPFWTNGSDMHFQVKGPNSNYPVALNLNGTNEFALGSLTSITTYPFTMGGWVNVVSGTSAQTAISLLDASVANKYFTVGLDSSERPVIAARNTTEFTANGTEPLTQGQHTIIGIFSSATSRKLVVDGNIVATDDDSVALPSVNKLLLGLQNTNTPANYGQSPLAGHFIAARELSLDECAAYHNAGNGLGVSSFVGSPFFGGYLENKEFDGPGQQTKETLRLTSRGYLSILQDAIVSPVVYTDQAVEAIVIDLVSREAPTIDTSNVATTGVTLAGKRAFSGISLYDALRQLAELGDCYFYVDSQRKLYFQKIGNTISGLNLIAGQNIINSYVTESRKPTFNKVWVYGNRMLVDGGRETFTANGGSVYSLKYKPHNTSVFVAGSTVSKQGGILNFVGQTDPGSGTQYLVSYDAKQIVFVSGTNAGMNIPISGTDTFVVEYQRERQIIKYAQDDQSVETYKGKTKWVKDNNIRDPKQAQITALNELEQNAWPFVEINTTYKGWADVAPGVTAGIYEPYQEVSGTQFNIIKAKYHFSPQNMRSDEVVELTLNKKIIDGADIVKQALLDIKRLRAEDVIDDEIYTRMQLSTGSMGARVNNWTINTRTVGNAFILGHPINGKLGDRGNTALPWNWDWPAHNWTSGTATQGLLGNYRGPVTFVVSGGEL